MSNTTFFTGQPLFNQLLQLIPSDVLDALTRKYQTDRYYKTFKTYDHIVSMLYCSFFKCTSLRELCTGLQACEHKLRHLGLKHTPRKSTLAEANSKRTEQFFADLYHQIYQRYYNNIPDSGNTRSVEERMFLIDSTTIKLFTDVMKGAGSKPLNGKQKGGAKAHVLMKADENVPKIIHLTHASKNDRNILPLIQVPQGSILVFDMGYSNYKQFESWTEQKIIWVTRLHETAWVEEVSSTIINLDQKQAGVISDQIVRLGRPSNKPTTKLTVRRIKYYDAESKRTFTFITNNLTMDALTIAGIYKKRWQIELLFKRIKQNYPLRFFLGESENAIKIQIWCAFIADLLIKIIQDKVKVKKWAFANIAGMIRQHLMTYIDIIKFLSDPDKALLNYRPTDNNSQLQFSFYG
jgi:hypothetical protein